MHIQTYLGSGIWKGLLQNRFNSCVLDLLFPNVIYENIFWNVLSRTEPRNLKGKIT